MPSVRPRRPSGKVWAAKVGIGRRQPGKNQLHELESFTSASMQEWAAYGQANRDYQYALFFDLESQRAARQNDLCAALRGSSACRVDLDGWFRLVNFKYSLSPLSPAGSLRWVGGRFNYGQEIDADRFTPFPALYVAEDFLTAFREYHSLAPTDVTSGLSPQELSLEDSGSWATLRLRGHVSNVFDLTRSRSIAEFCKVISKFTLSNRVREAERRANRSATTLVRAPRELMASLSDRDWKYLPVHFDIPSNSQVFGKLLIESGFEGVLYRSAKSRRKCLAIFTRQLVGSDSVISLHEDRPSEIEFCEINASNCLQV